MTAIAHQPHPVTRALAGARDQLCAVAETPVWSMDAGRDHHSAGRGAGRQGPAGRARGPTPGPRRPHRARRATGCDLDRELARPRHPHHPGPGPPGDAARPGPRGPRPDPHRARRRAGSMSSRPRPSSAPSPSCPTTSTPHLVQEAERHLLDLAAQYDAKALKHLGHHILEVACPDAADAHQATLLEREERDAAGSHPADPLGRRARQAPRQVHPRHPDRRDAQESTSSHSPPPNTAPPKDPSANAAPPPNGSGRPSSS